MPSIKGSSYNGMQEVNGTAEDLEALHHWYPRISDVTYGQQMNDAMALQPTAAGMQQVPGGRGNDTLVHMDWGPQRMLATCHKGFLESLQHLMRQPLNGATATCTHGPVPDHAPEPEAMHVPCAVQVMWVAKSVSWGRLRHL